jgi:hypothetical protein
VTISHISNADADVVSGRVLSAIVDVVPEYAAIAATRRPTLMAANRRNTHLYLRVLNSRRMPTAAESGCLSTAARERVNQGISLPALSRACRIGARVLWEQIRPLAGLDEALLTDLTLRYIDFASNAAETAYMAEREHLLNPAGAARRISFIRLVEDDFGEAHVRIEALRTLGIDPADPQIGLVIQTTDLVSHGQGLDDTLEQAIAALQQFVPLAGYALIGGRAVASLPAASPSGVRSALVPILTAINGARSPLRSTRPFALTAGVGTVRSGDRAIATTIRDADRARLLGTVMAPDEVVHVYDDVRSFDFFEPGRRLDAFVTEVLADILEHDRHNGSDIVRTLHTYISNGQNRKAAARALGIHPNTLDYRLRRAAAIADADILSAGNAFRFELALRLLPMCSPDATRLGQA